MGFEVRWSWGYRDSFNLVCHVQRLIDDGQPQWLKGKTSSLLLLLIPAYLPLRSYLFPAEHQLCEASRQHNKRVSFLQSIRVFQRGGSLGGTGREREQLTSSCCLAMSCRRKELRLGIHMGDVIGVSGMAF